MFKLSSTRLVTQLRDRASQLRGQAVAASITTPDELNWVYIQNFGTTKHDYPITPVNAEALHLPEGSGYPGGFFAQVIHPGVTGKHFVEKVIPEIHTASASKLAEVMVSSGYNPDEIREVFINQVMPEVKELIAASIDDNLGPSRTDGGKLHGTAPGQAFRDKAGITEKA